MKTEYHVGKFLVNLSTAPAWTLETSIRDDA